MSLTHGAVTTMVRSLDQAPSFNPILQFIHVKPVGPDKSRFRVIISDGEHFVQGMLATQLNEMVHSNGIQENALVKIDEYMKNTIQDRIVIIVLSAKVVNTNIKMRLGNPQDIEKASVAISATAAPTSTAQPMYNRTNHQPSAPSSRSRSNPYGAPKNTGTTSYGGPSNGPNQGAGGQSYRIPGSNASAPIVRSNAYGGPSQNHLYTPIDQLNMYQNRWTIKARVTSKGDVRTWSNARGEGSLFSIELLDSSGMDIRATFFKEAVDKFFGLLQVNSVYTFSGGRLKVANMQYNTCKSQYEVTFDQNSEIHLADDTGDIQQNIFDFIKIDQLEAVPEGKNVDVLAIVKSVGEPAALVSKKTGRDLTKCDMTLRDDSGAEVNLTVWGDKANSAPVDYANQPVVAFRRARVSDYGGKSLSAGDVIISPPIPEAQSLHKWWHTGGGDRMNATKTLSSAGGGGMGKLTPFAERKPISAIKDEHLGTNMDNPDFIAFRGTFTFFKKDKEGGAWYPACPNAGEPCKNRFKVTNSTDQKWFCDKCQGTFDTCVRRWIFSGTVADSTSTTWVSIFNEQAETLFGGLTADAAFAKCIEPDTDMMNQDIYDGFFEGAKHSEYIFRCKVKNEMVGDEPRTKTSVLGLHPMDYARESRDLLEDLKKMSISS